MITIELLDKVIDRVIQLVMYKREHDRTFFENHIKPTFEAVSVLHEAYLASFKDYLNAVGENSQSLQPLIDRVETEKIFEDHARQRILAATSILPNTTCTGFIELIRSYVVHPTDLAGGETAVLRREGESDAVYE